MKRFIWMALMALLILPACNVADSPESNSDTPLPLNRVQIAVVEAGIPQLTVPTGKLKSAFQKAYGVRKVGHFGVKPVDEVIFLNGFMEYPDGTTESFGIALDPIDGGWGMNAYSTKQTCTKKNGCTECELTELDKVSGYCKCTENKPVGKSGCTHKVTSEEPSTLAKKDPSDLPEENRRMAQVVYFLTH